MTINGPGKDKLAITGLYNGVVEQDRIITHTGGGQLLVGGVSLSNGYVSNLAYQGGAKGGCISSAGNLILVNVDVHDCKTLVDNGFSYGGGVYAKGGLRLKYDVISHNNAESINYLGVEGC